jgi:hypothetical protein
LGAHRPGFAVAHRHHQHQPALIASAHVGLEAPRPVQSLTPVQSSAQAERRLQKTGRSEGMRRGN